MMIKKRKFTQVIDKSIIMYYMHYKYLLYYKRRCLMPVLTVRLDEKSYLRLQKLASKNRRTKSSFIKEMLEIFLEDFEDAYSALERLNKKNSKYLTTEEVEKELGL